MESLKLLAPNVLLNQQCPDHRSANLLGQESTLVPVLVTMVCDNLANLANLAHLRERSI